jgi:quinol monooxygenase YgiN
MDPFMLIVEMAIKPGRLEDFKAAAAALYELSSSETGTLRYDWYISEDGTRQVTVEQFADSAAFVAHNGHVASAVPPLLESADVTGAQVLGDVDDEARERLKGLAAVHFGFEGGLDR